MTEQKTENRSAEIINNAGLDPVRQIIDAKAVLSPMAGVTDAPFRIMARRRGCAFAFTEMIDVNGIVYNNRKTFTLMERRPEDSPLGIQIVGQDENKLLFTAKICEEKGFRLIDINAGCPARKVIKAGKGSALLKDPLKLGRIIGRLAKEVSVPVTVKIRSGWDEDNLNYLEVAKIAASEGARAICVHPKTREQMYKGKADHGIVREVREAVDIPVFASGNIFSPRDAADVLKNTGCDAVFVARGSLGRPWIFRDIKRVLSGEDAPADLSFGEIVDVIHEHFALCLNFYDEYSAVRKMYKHVTWYLKKFKGLNDVMRAYRKVAGYDSFREFLGGIRARDRHLVFEDSGPGPYMPC
ncbi:MAG: tRNA dihydrouridine synthase DusB [Candidatus Omnitrophota bacterium]